MRWARSLIASSRILLEFRYSAILILEVPSLNRMCCNQCHGTALLGNLSGSCKVYYPIGEGDRVEVAFLQASLGGGWPNWSPRQVWQFKKRPGVWQQVLKVSLGC
jgi:hypothetical protein